MHELSLMEAVRRQALEQAERHGGGRITAITLRIGSLAGVEPEALALAFDVVMAGTAAAGAQLRIEPVAAACWCGPCQAEFPALDGLCECPRCGAISRQLLRGRELQLASLDLVDS
ncbi:MULTISPECIES: hydrogenase maturation nickel metallochaperone HypA [Aphanothece]|uniref:hydrogenase maturation nickel metallochaperone HypA n=1 Tax=Aphanothece TaxID=1121 RepID=UPI003984AFF0